MIFGDITIGNNVTISAGSVVTKSFPDGSLIAGNPARVIQRDYDNSLLINYTMPETRRRHGRFCIRGTGSRSVSCPG